MAEQFEIEVEEEPLGEEEVVEVLYRRGRHR